jgi:hypothetical protein
MQNLTVGRYIEPSVMTSYKGWIEPEDRSWIIFLDAEGMPVMYWRERGDDGSVIGDPVVLEP